MLRVIRSATRQASITPNVSFDKIAREWRCKWSADADNASLSAAQTILDGHLAEVKAVAGVESVQRVVCGGCLDFKVITKLDNVSFAKWADAKFEPEASLLAKLEAVEGVTAIETQTYTLMDM